MPEMRYDHPTYVTRQFSHFVVPAVAASTSAAKFSAYTSMKIKRIGANVMTAGTNTAAGFDIYNGTTSVGGLTAGTGAAGTVVTALTTDITLSSGGYLDIRTKANSATLQCNFTLEYEVVPGAEVA